MWWSPTDTAVVHFSTSSARIPINSASPAEAADVFSAYFQTDRVPESYTLRELDLTR